MMKNVWANRLVNALKYSSKQAEPRVEVGGHCEAQVQAAVHFDSGARSTNIGPRSCCKIAAATVLTL
jgi:hypothetical protein